ncbi:ubiquinol--cytochrome c reductase, cytochrome b [Legionella sainthelensi]|nr:ubiquinol--cytochrome c reductase, cytochrome b [Legionella sainthelensi]
MIAIPLLLFLFVFLHIVALHKVGSNNPDGIEFKNKLDEEKQFDLIPFHPYYIIKDLVAVLAFLILFFAAVFWAPEMGGYFLEPNNFVPANPLVTPDHIAPMWYMSPFYAILRAIPDKLLGIICMGSALLLLFFLPWLDCSPVRSMRYKGIWSKLMLFLGVLAFIVLGYLGTIPVTPLRLLFARLATLLYFSYFIFMPFYTRMEATHPLPLRSGAC